MNPLFHKSMIPAPVPALLLASLFFCRPALCAEPYMPSLDSLYASGLPVLFVDTDSMALPTADPADPPEGCFGATITNRTSVSGRVYMVRCSSDTRYDSGLYVKSVSGMTIRLNYTYKYPDSDDITEYQSGYISDYMAQLEASIGDGTYDRYLDVEITRMKTSLNVSRTFPDGHERESAHYYDMFGRRREEESEWRFMKCSPDGRTGIVF